MNICVVGTGYVGLVTGTCLAEGGNNVVCVDKIEEKIERLKRGEVPIYEPGLEELVARNRREERLAFSTDVVAAVKQSKVIFIAVGTPSLESGGADLSAVFSVAETIAGVIEDFTVIVTKSTVPPGTAERVRNTIGRITKVPFAVASNPEFLKEGNAVEDFMKPDRVVIGTDSDEASAILKEIYAPYVRTGAPIIVMDSRSAEMTKYAANCLLAVRISLINEIANLCEKLGADVNMVRQGVGADSRIGYKFLFPGVGYGGSCFPKDVRALSRAAKELGGETPILDAADETNSRQPLILVEKVLRHFDGDISDKTIGIWGLAFKPKTDDMREAPSVPIIEMLLEKGAKVRAYDPVALGEARKIFGDRIELVATSYSAIDGADALVLVTEWNEFRNPDFDKVKSMLRTPAIFDGRNIWRAEPLRQLGFIYHGIGV